MNPTSLPASRVREMLTKRSRQQILVVGDFMLDQFVWGRGDRISPEAPVPVLEFQRESHVPGGAANVARNLAILNIPCSLVGPIGKDHPNQTLKELLTEKDVKCSGLFASSQRPTSIKTRIVAHQQQVVRVDPESRGGHRGRQGRHRDRFRRGIVGKFRVTTKPSSQSKSLRGRER
jgi:D-beta-D-heptose 7-phosphate kinase/D-beta-D-heptose 1-phosphate adenosyltransferase